MSKRKYSDADIESICRLRDRLSASEIAATFGVTRNTIIGVWKRNPDRCKPVPRHERANRQSRTLIASNLARRLSA